MTSDEEERLRAWYGSLARRAHDLYAEGHRSREVLRRCYGVMFPEEFFVLGRERSTRPHLMAHFTNVPWNLAVPPDEGGPPASAAGITTSVEAHLLDLDPDLVPLMELIGSGTTLDRAVLCYRLTELRAGSTAVFGCRRSFGPGVQPPRSGASLLAVLHQHHTEFLEHAEWTMRQPWNRGFGALEQRMVDTARELLERVEQLRHDVA